jgi:hypothetical protein
MKSQWVMTYSTISRMFTDRLSAKYQPFRTLRRQIPSRAAFMKLRSVSRQEINRIENGRGWYTRLGAEIEAPYPGKHLFHQFRCIHVG